MIERGGLKKCNCVTCILVLTYSLPILKSEPHAASLEAVKICTRSLSIELTPYKYHTIYANRPYDLFSYLIMPFSFSFFSHSSFFFFWIIFYILKMLILFEKKTTMTNVYLENEYNRF